MAFNFEQMIEEILYLGDETDEKSMSESTSLSESESDMDEFRTESFRQTYITVTSFRAVLERLAQPDFNFIKEQITAAAVLKLLNLGDSHLQKFDKLLDSVARLFGKCYLALKSPRKQVNVRASELEKNFTVERFNSVVVNSVWSTILTTTALIKNSSAENVLQHILQHFWSTINRSTYVKNSKMETDVPKAESDSSELSAISYHAGWGIKRARDIIKHASDEQLQIQNATNTKDFHHIEKSRALEVISNLGEDEKQADGLFKFIPTTKTLPFLCCSMTKLTVCSLSHISTQKVLIKAINVV